MLEVKRQFADAADGGEIRKELSVGEVAKRSGVAVSTLHFYEAKGLIRSARSRGNQRRFPRGVLRRIAVIKVAQSAGIPLATILQALRSLPKDVAPTREDWRKLSTVWRMELDGRSQAQPAAIASMAASAACRPPPVRCGTRRTSSPEGCRPATA